MALPAGDAAMTRSTLCVAVLACVVSATVGWGVGVVMNPRVNTAAARAFAEGVDMQLRASVTREVAAANATCAMEVADAQADVTAARAATRETQEQLSERIVGLRDQLRAAGIRERVEEVH